MRVGVVICAYTMRRWELLERAVASVEAQDVRSDLVLVIDHNDELLAKSRARWPNHRVIANAHTKGLSGARNTGVEALDGDLVAFLDDDACAKEGWLRELIAPFESADVGLSGGFVQPDYENQRPAWFPEEFLWVVGCSYVGLPETPATVRNPIGASMAIRRSLFDQVGNFHEGVGRVDVLPMGCEETEFAIRAAGAGYVTRYVPASVVEHRVDRGRCTISYFTRRCYAEGKSKAIVAAAQGSDAALSSERAYVSKTLVQGVTKRARQLVTGPRGAAAGSTLAMAAGCAAAGAGYAVARVQAFRR